MSINTLIPGSVKSAMKAVNASSADLWNVPPHLIKVIPGYNVRIRNEAYNKVVQSIKESILANGFNRDSALSVYVARGEDGDEICLVRGHRRLEAVLLAIAEGKEIPTVPCIAKPKGTNEEDLIIDLKIGNEGEPITLLEQAILCKRLSSFGWETSQIAHRMGLTNQRTDDFLLLAAAPAVIRNHVSEDRISATLAIELIKKHGSKVVDVVSKLVNGTSKKKVTAKDVPELKFKQVIRKQAEPLFDVVNKVQLDPAFSSLNVETQELISKLIKEIQK